MKLVEYRGKQLLKNAGIRTPPGIITDNKSYINLSYHKNKFSEFFFEHNQVMIKAQIPYGYRKKLGFIKESSDYKEALQIIDEMYNKKYRDQAITTLLIEKKLDVAEEYYLSIVYDTDTRKPMIVFSTRGGIDIEDVLTNSAPVTKTVSILEGLHDFEAREIAKMAGISDNDIVVVSKFIQHCYEAFIKYDCKALEINPVIKTAHGKLLYAGDAKITIDDNAVSRHDIFHDVTDIEDRSILTERELEARKIDYHDHRGVAGKSYLDLDGDIAVLASGGGASLTCMDALIQAGGKPANYTEYSGNPPREKVKRLTEVTLSKEGLNGCLVIGGTANFTDVFETLCGFKEGLESLGVPKFPIVVRRAGPNYEKAFKLLKEFKEKYNLDMEIFGEETPMTEAVRLMVKKANQYKEGL
jgi:succinyl-CoA synthetase beta subunit